MLATPGFALGFWLELHACNANLPQQFFKSIFIMNGRKAAEKMVNLAHRVALNPTPD